MGLAGCGCLFFDSVSNTVDDFWNNCKKSDGCWEWQLRRDKEGYGHFFIDNRRWLAHRFSWTLINGPIPDGLQVLHSCDNPPCIRPDHLSLGTNLENNRDKIAKNRDVIFEGSRHANSKLNEAKVVEIRKRAVAESYSSIARSYEVSVSTISEIVNGLRWRFQQAQRHGVKTENPMAKIVFCIPADLLKYIEKLASERAALPYDIILEQLSKLTQDFDLAGAAGVEPATSFLEGKHSVRLSYAPVKW